MQALGGTGPCESSTADEMGEVAVIHRPHTTLAANAHKNHQLTAM